MRLNATSRLIEETWPELALFGMSEPAIEPSAAAAEETKTYIPLSEIAKHNTLGDLWIAVNGKVYNATSFVDQHPGGEEVLLEHAGKDATEAFDDVGHSETAVELLDELYVGEGNPAELKIVQRKAQVGLGEIEESSSNNTLLIIVAAVVAGVAYFYYKATRD